MDFDLGNILYILVTIVAIVAGLAGKKKKKPVSGAAAPKVEKSPLNFLEQLGINIEELNDKQEVEYRVEDEDVYDESPEVAEPVYQEVKPSLYSSFEGVYNPEMDINRPLIEREAIAVTDPIEVIELDDEFSSDEDLNDIICGFDPVKAVIYSEILHRREY